MYVNMGRNEDDNEIRCLLSKQKYLKIKKSEIGEKEEYLSPSTSKEWLFLMGKEWAWRSPNGQLKWYPE